MAADWSRMPAYILDKIVGKLICCQDFPAFSVICRSWYSAYARAKHRWSPRMPWLVLSENTKDNPGYLRKFFFDPSIGKCYQLKFPKTIMCWGSAYGWIIGMDHVKLDMFMFNPFSGARVELPSAYTLPMPMDISWKENKEKAKIILHMLDRIILLKIPQKDNKEDMVEEEEYLAVSICSMQLMQPRIGVSRPSDLVWIPIALERSVPVRYISDVAYWNDALFILMDGGALFRVELNYGFMNRGRGVLFAKDYSPSWALMELPLNRSYMMESSGNLFVILRSSRRIITLDTSAGVMYVAPYFSVFKFIDETKGWRHFKDLDETSLLVGFNSAMAIKACETSNSRRNCSYFTDYRGRDWLTLKDWGGHDMGIFSIEDDNKLGKNNSSAMLLYHGEESQSAFRSLSLFCPKL